MCVYTTNLGRLVRENGKDDGAHQHVKQKRSAVAIGNKTHISVYKRNNYIL